jgi:hypothetical protein
MLDAHIDARVLHLGMLTSAMGSVVSCVLMMSMVMVVQIHLSKNEILNTQVNCRGQAVPLHRVLLWRQHRVTVPIPDLLDDSFFPEKLLSC